MKLKEKIQKLWRNRWNSHRKLPSVMTSLFDWELELVLETIFLLLDGASLHASRQVCRRWDRFIVDNIWGRKVVRKKLENKLYGQWKCSSGSQSTINLNPKYRNDCTVTVPPYCQAYHGWIWSVDCDKSIIFFGFTNGKASVLEHVTGEIKQTLDLKHSALNMRVKVKVGESILVTMCDGILCIFDKVSYDCIGMFASSMMPREKERPMSVRNNTVVARGNELFQCMVIQISGDRARSKLDSLPNKANLSSGSDSASKKEPSTYQTKTIASHGSIKCLDYDGNFIVMLVCTAENHSDMQVHNINEDDMSVIKVFHRTNHIHGVTLRYPNVILAIGAFLGEPLGSFVIIDVNSRDVIRRVTPRIGSSLPSIHPDHSQMAIRHIHVQLNDRFLFFCSHGHRTNEWVKCQGTMFDMDELMEKEVTNEELWMRRMDEGHISYVDNVRFLAATKTTAKFFNFWLSL